MFQMKNVLTKNSEMEGFNNVLIDSTNMSKYIKVQRRYTGKTPEQRALIRQWLQYCILYLRGRHAPSIYIMKELDNALVDTTFFAGHFLTLVDPLMYLSLHPTFVS